MSDATKRVTAGTSADGNAGEASIFLVLADRKVKENGLVALVMPLSLMLGESWEDSRLLLRRDYSDLTVISIAGDTDADSSFSADTDMAEWLVVGRKSMASNKRATFVILNERPAYPLMAEGAAQQITRLVAKRNLRRLEAEPFAGTPLYVAEDLIR